MKRRITALIVAALMTTSVIPSLAAQDDTAYATREYVVSEFVQSVGRNNLSNSAYMLSTFKDSDEISDEYVNDFEKAVSSGLIRGDDAGTLRPKDNITRVEALTILSRCIPEDDNATGEPIAFTDVPGWAKDAVDSLSKAGIVYGYGDGTLGAEDNITVEQVKLLTDRSDEMLNTVPVGESFYGHINNKTFRNAQLSSTSSIDAVHGAVITKADAWSHFGDIQNNISERENELLEKLMNDELEYEDGTPEQRIHDMLLCIQDSVNMTDGDKKAVTDMRDRIINAKSINELISVTCEMTESIGISPLLDIYTAKDPETNKPYPQIAMREVGAGGIINYRKATRDAFSDYYTDAIKTAMDSIGFTVSDDDIKSAVEIQECAATDSDYAGLLYMGFFTRILADASTELTDSAAVTEAITKGQERIKAEMEKVIAEHPDVDPVTFQSNKQENQFYTADEINKISSKINLAGALKSVGFKKTDNVFSSTAETLTALDKLITEKNLNALKINTLIGLYEKLNCYLTGDEEVAFKNLEYVGNAAMSYFEGDEKPTQEDTDKMMDYLRLMLGMTGGDGTEDDSDDILSAKNLNMLVGALPYDIALMYCDYYYDDKISEDVADIIDEIWDEYIETFEKNTWMDAATKENAINKIKNMVAVIGYPDNYVFPNIIPPEDGGTYFTNTLNIMQNDLNTTIRECDEENFTREQMLMSPDIVNACYMPDRNITNILAGILQHPIYDPNASRAQNLGAIGAIIGHEIGHAFDNTGSQYDENGCLKNWWTEKDAEEYNKRVETFVEYYKNFSVVDGVVQDSTITIGENMADFAGMRCVLNILEGDKEAQKEAMESWANTWAQLGTEKYVTNLNLLNDVHSSNNVRVDGVIASMDEFYEIYDISEDDPMYVAPEKRLKLW